jgi:hypothetical protein
MVGAIAFAVITADSPQIALIGKDKGVRAPVTAGTPGVSLTYTEPTDDAKTGLGFGTAYWLLNRSNSTDPMFSGWKWSIANPTFPGPTFAVTGDRTQMAIKTNNSLFIYPLGPNDPESTIRLSPGDIGASPNVPASITINGYNVLTTNPLSGSISDDRLSTNILRLNAATKSFTGKVTMPADTTIGSVSSTELGYLDGVSSPIQNQITAKAPKVSPAFAGTVIAEAISFTGNIPIKSTNKTVPATLPAYGSSENFVLSYTPPTTNVYGTNARVLDLVAGTGTTGSVIRLMTGVGNGDALTRLVIAPSGNVGIGGGDVVPDEKLDVKGNIKASGNVTASKISVTGVIRVVPQGDISMGDFTSEPAQ